MKELIPIEIIERKIHLIRGHKVMRDVAMCDDKFKNYRVQ